MPVKIEIGDNSNDPRVINLKEYMAGRANFSLHYFYTPAQESFEGEVIDAQWDDLQNAVQDFMTQTSTLAADVALRFVHCFIPSVDGSVGQLFLRLQICKMIASPVPPPPGIETVYDLDTTGALWYEISNGSFAPTLDDNLSGINYLSNFYYRADPASAMMEVLTDGPTVYVKNLVLPWANEILQMYVNNGSPLNAGIHFAACSYYATQEHANVEWPHGLVVFLTDNTGHPMLDNTDYISIFHNKGADFATLCPPTCNQYLMPTV